MTFETLERAARAVLLDARCGECSAFADALGVEHECGAAAWECERCAAETAAALAGRLGMERDTQGRIDADAAKDPCGYFGRAGSDCDADGGCPALDTAGGCREAMARDLLRRQRELCAKEAGR